MEWARLLHGHRNTKGARRRLIDGFPHQEELERAKGFEPSTPTLARLCSTPELHPHAPSLVLAGWWSQAESNRRPLECHSSALPTELRPHKTDRRPTLPLQRFAPKVADFLVP